MLPRAGREGSLYPPCAQPSRCRVRRGPGAGSLASRAESRSECMMVVAPVGRANLGRAVSLVCRGRPALEAARRPSPSPALRARRSATVRLRVWSRASRPPPCAPSDRRPDPVGAVQSPLHRAGVRPPGGGAEGRVGPASLSTPVMITPWLPPTLRAWPTASGTLGSGSGRGQPHLSSDLRPRGRRACGDSRVARLQAAPGAAPDLKATARPGLAEVGVSQRGGSP